MNNYKPKNFVFCYFKLAEGHTCIRLKEDKLIYSGTEERIIKPNKTEWLNFRDTIEKIDIWSWEELYDVYAAEDEFSWELNLEYEDESIISDGINMNPIIELADEKIDGITKLIYAIEELTHIKFR